MALTMSPDLYRILEQNLMRQGMGMIGGRRKKGSRCPKGQRKKKVSFKACRKGKGILLGGCECCMGQGCANCMNMSGGRKRNKWVSCLRKYHNVPKCRAQKKLGYPVSRTSSVKRRAPAKRKISPQAKKALSDYNQILKVLRKDNPNGNYKMLQKEASSIYQSGQY
jgi:hypothetical protein